MIKPTHDENCAPRRILELFSIKWTSMVLHALHSLHDGTCRTGELQRSLPGISKKMLTQTLREMERDGLLSRHVFDVVPPRVEYTLTPLGRQFIEPIEMLYEWGRTHADALAQLGQRPRSRRRPVPVAPEQAPGHAAAHGEMTGQPREHLPGGVTHAVRPAQERRGQAGDR
jgi:DNA-binding HxlR family transcriptional regulator